MCSLVYLLFVSILFSIGTESNSEIVPCNVNVLLSNLKFTLFTRENQDTGVALNSETYSSVDPDDLTTIIIPGWLQANMMSWVRVMTDTYLNNSTANIILIDWSAYAGINRFQAVCAVPYVGSFVGDLIYNLTRVGINVTKVQINGFSLGAHVAGAAGQRIFAISGSKVRRINGLDASNLEFSGKPIDQRLDASDAVFVQAIHTNNDGFGYAANYGTIDFHINTNFLTCGTFQPGCPLYPGVPTDGSLLPYSSCDHIRAVAYYILSIISNQFLGVTCSSCFNFAIGSCNSNPKTIMGEMCPFDQSGVRYVKTNVFAEG